ncbi:MAG: DnaJ domain-containing protein [Planctomycetes bacterium]|nr:DnaJ domain-containing protein [Planctomycetota bacterium]
MGSDYYQILGLTPAADDDLIDKAYRLLARRYHPDQRPDQNDVLRFRQIQEAYEVLSSPRLKMQYDQGRLELGPAARAGAGIDVYQMLRLRFDQAARGGRVTITRMGPRGEARQLDVNVPRAVEDGARLRLRGQGGASSPSGPHGDLLIVVSVEPHRVFRRDGLDLHVDVDVPVDVAMLGGRVSAPTLDGEVDVEIPPGTTGGEKLRVRAAGLKNNDNQFGDLYAVVRVRIPKTVSQRAQQMAADAPVEAPSAPPASTDDEPALRLAPEETEDDLAQRQARLDRMAGRLDVRHRRLAGFRAALRRRLNRLEVESHSSGQQREVLAQHAMLVMVDQDNQRRTFPLAKPVTVIGRRGSCELSIPLTSISREHCQIDFRDGQFFVRDLQSSNGVLVNDQRVSESPLKAGDVIHIGAVYLGLTLGGEPAQMKVPPSTVPGDADPIVYSAAAVAAYHEFVNHRKNQDQMQAQAQRLADGEAALAEQRREVDEAAAQLQRDRQRVDEERAALARQSDAAGQQMQQVAQRRAEVDQAAAALDAQRSKIEQQRTELEDRTRSLAEQQRRHETHKAELDALRLSLHEQREKASGQATDLDADRTALAEARREVERQQVDLVAQRQSLDTRAQELDQLQRRLDQQQQDHARHVDDLSQQRRAADEHKARTDAAAAALAATSAALEAERTSLHQQRDQQAARQAQLDHRAAELEESHRKVEAERAQCRTDRQAVESDRIALETRHADIQERLALLEHQQREASKAQQHADRQLETAQRRSEELEHRAAELNQRQAQLDGRASDMERRLKEVEAAEARVNEAAQVKAVADAQSAALADERAKLEVQRRELDERVAKLAADEQTHQQEQMELIRRSSILDQREQRLTKQLNDLPEHLRRLGEQRLATESLHQQLIERQAELDAFLQRVQKKQEEASEQQRQLDAAQKQMREAAAELESQKNQIAEQRRMMEAQAAEQVRTLAELAQKQRMLDEQRAEIERLRAEAAAEPEPVEAVKLEPVAPVQIEAPPSPAPSLLGPPPGAEETIQTPSEDAVVETTDSAAPHFQLVRADNRALVDLTPHHIRTAAGYIDRKGAYHLFVDYIDQKLNTVNSWGAEIRYYRSKNGKAWDWVQTAIERGPAGENAADGYGAASPAIVQANHRLLMFYAGRGDLEPGASPNILARPGSPGYLPSRIMLAVAHTDSVGSPVGTFAKRGVVVDLNESWGNLRLDYPAAAIEDDTVHLFYTAYDDARSLDHRVLGYATANLKDLNFTVRPTPILEVRGGGEMPRIVRHAGQWHLFYQHYSHVDGARWRHYVANTLPHFELLDSNFFDGVHGESNPIMFWTDLTSRLPDEPTALITSAAGANWRLFPYALRPAHV